MSASKLIKKLEVEKGFRCNCACATCICEKARKAVREQYEVYAEAYAELQGTVDAEKYAKKVCKLEKEDDALSKCCDRLSEDFFEMIDDEVDDYLTAEGLQEQFAEMEENESLIARCNLGDFFIDKHTGGDRYTRE